MNDREKLKQLELELLRVASSMISRGEKAVTVRLALLEASWSLTEIQTSLDDRLEAFEFLMDAAQITFAHGKEMIDLKKRQAESYEQEVAAEVIRMAEEDYNLPTGNA